MIHTVTGDILQSNAEAIVNTVNTVGVMGKGLALQFKEAYPDNYRLYRAACAAQEVKVGSMFITVERTLSGDRTIVNFPTKTTWRRPSEYSYIASGLKALRKEMRQRRLRSIAIPPLGSHNGGLDWKRVKPMIIEALGDMDCDIYIYEPSAAIIERMKSERVRLTPARAMLLDVLHDTETEGELASVFVAEKAVYFLQRLGASDAFHTKFTPYIYGPYSGGVVSHVLHALNGSYIKGMGDMSAKPFEPIWLLPDTPSAVRQYLSATPNREYQATSERTKDFLSGFYSSLSLEMLSTTDYILTTNSDFTGWQREADSKLIPRIRVYLRDWSKRKERLLAEDSSITIMLEHLRQMPTISK